MYAAQGLGTALPATHSDQESRVVKLKGLPYRVSKQEIVDFFHGLDVVFVHFVYESDNGPSGLAFVEFQSAADATAALAKRGECMQNRFIKVLQVSYKEMQEQVLLGTAAIPTSRYQPWRPDAFPSRAPRPPFNSSAMTQLAQAVALSPLVQDRHPVGSPPLRALLPSHPATSPRPQPHRFPATHALNLGPGAPLLPASTRPPAFGATSVSAPHNSLHPALAPQHAISQLGPPAAPRRGTSARPSHAHAMSHGARQQLVVSVSGEVLSQSSHVFRAFLAAGPVVAVTGLLPDPVYIVQDVLHLFGGFAVDVSSIMYRIDDAGVPTGDAWLRMLNRNDASRACQMLNGRMYQGSMISVTIVTRG